MSSNDKKNYVIAFLLCTTLGGAALVVHTRQQLADAKSAPTLKVTKSEFKTAAAPAPIVSAPAPAPAAEVSPPEEAIERPEGGPPGGNRGQRGAQFAAQMAELMKDPDFVAAMKLEQEARVEQRYGALFKDLNLPPAQLAALKAMLIERDNANREVMVSAAAQGMNPRDNRDELRKLTADLQAEVDGNIAAQLGTSVATALKDYNSSTSQRNTVNALAEKLSITDKSLNSSQAKQMTAILTETGTQQGRNTLITDATITRAAGVLNSDQLTALKAVQAQQQAEQLLQEKMRAAREAAGGGNGGGNNGGGNWRNRN